MFDELLERFPAELEFSMFTRERSCASLPAVPAGCHAAESCVVCLGRGTMDGGISDRVHHGEERWAGADPAIGGHRETTCSSSEAYIALDP